jgi:hypothetical protein
MSKRTASLLAWSMYALSLVLTALSLSLLALTLSYPNVHVFSYWVENTLVAVVFSTVGAVILPHRPNNPVGWLFCLVGLLAGARHFASEYAIYNLLAAPGSLPGGEALAWVSAWAWIPNVGLMVFWGLLFPEGQMLSSRWRWFAWLSVLLFLVGTILEAISPGPLAGHGPIQNPVGIEGMRNVVSQVHALIWLLVLVTAVSVLIRFRRARGVERQQLKWFTYTAAVAAGGGTLAYIGSEAISVHWLWLMGFILMLVGFVSLPISMGIAILRYRLYEIDLIINRTLVYGSLTAILAFVYFGSVTLLQSLLSLLTGQGSTLAIVVSTLAIAALFNPLRRRIQGFIDRRFYRRKYDAAKTLEVFGARLRDETDLEKLCEDLGEVVDETMQPAHLSVILRSEVPSSTTREQGQQDQQTTTKHEG